MTHSDNKLQTSAGGPCLVFKEGGKPATLDNVCQHVHSEILENTTK